MDFRVHMCIYTFFIVLTLTFVKMFEFLTFHEEYVGTGIQQI